ncbi:MAG: DUF167 domain-containing protein [Candidatus Buchananbacteria bacterium]
MTKDILARVIPNSSQTKIIEEKEGYLKIKLQAPPVDGKANAELIKFLAKRYGVSKSKVEILKGLTAKEKLVRIYLI